MIKPESFINIFKLSGIPSLVLLTDSPFFTIAAVNSAFLNVTQTKEEWIVGKGLFDCFPENPAAINADGLSNLLASLHKVISSGKPHKMDIQRYDIIQIESEIYEEHYWQVENIPVISQNDEVEYILHRTTDVTSTVLLERKKQEATVKNQFPDQVFRTIIQESSDLIGIVDAGGNYKYAGPSFETLLGFDPQDFIGKNAFDFIHPDEKDRVFDEFSKLATEKRVNVSPCRFKHKDKGWRWVETVLTNLLNDPAVNGIVALSRDITERMQAEEELRTSEAKYKRLFKFSPVPKMVYDIETLQILDVNEIALKKYGYSRAEFLQMTIEDMMPQGISSNFKNPESDGSLVHFGIRSHLKKDKTIIKVEVSGNKFSHEGRNCMMVVFIDVTERENAFRQLRSNEKKLLAAQKIAKIGYWKFDIRRENLFWSDEMYNIWAVSKDNFKVNYQSFFESMHPEDREAFENARSMAISGEKDMDFEFRIIHRDGTEKWVHEKGKVIKNEFGEPVTFEGTVQDITEGKLLKLSLEESNQRYHYVTKATFDAIWDWDLLKDKNYWGGGFHKIFGYDLQTISDKDFWTTHIHPEDYERILGGMEKALKGTDSNWMNEYRFRKADNTYVYVCDRGIIIRDQAGKAIRMVGAMQDISEKKTLLQLLDKANRLARIGSWEIDVESATVYWSDITKEIRETDPGYQPTLEDGIGHFKEGFSRETIIKRVKESAKYGTSWQEDLQIYTHKGNLKWMRTIGKAEFSGGKCVKIYGSFQDIDKSKKAELEILKLYEEKNTILESIGDGFFALDKNWVVTYWNKQAEIILLRSKEEMLGKNIWEVFSDAGNIPFFKYYHKAVEEMKVQHFEEFYPALNLWVEVSAFPSEYGLSVYFKDITDRTISQMQLNQLNEDLRKTAADLAVSNAELEQFAYIASHDLQEPLRMISSFLSQLEKKYGNIIDDKGKQYIYFAVDGAKRMRQIILDLLEFSRVGRPEGHLENVDVKEVVNEIISLHKQQIEDTSATIHFDNLPVIKSYKSPLRQVILNLVSNALKYHKAGVPPLIHIFSEDFPDHWQIAVQDNGIGIDESFYDRIFIIFQRLHNKDEYSGTGIGLAIVKKIVENMGGQIWIKPNEEQGTTFFFTIQK